MKPMQRAVQDVQICQVIPGMTETRLDEVVVEEPMEVRIQYRDRNRTETRSLAITMRTPGHDFDLAAGFLLSEGICNSPAEIVDISYCLEPTGEQHLNIVTVALHPDVQVDPDRFTRNVYTSSSCGICGKASIELVHRSGLNPVFTPHSIRAEVVFSLPERLRAAQVEFLRTGGLHASAFCTFDGEMISIREDVGRHNALDKLIGRAFMQGLLPLHERIIVVSGRASFELVQKAVVAGSPVMVAVGAPSSLAVELAEKYGLTLIGFAREGRCNIYTGAQHIEGIQ